VIIVELEGKRLEIEQPSLTCMALKRHSKLPDTGDCLIVAARVNGKLMDLSTSLAPSPQPYQVEFVATDSAEGLAVLRHSASHIMTRAVKRVFPEHRIRLGVGPATKDGFYQDFGLPSLSEEDFPRIEAEMRKIVQKGEPFERRVVSKDEVLTLFAGDELKLELIGAMPEKEFSVYIQGEHMDLCRGPHVASAADIGAFKLLRASGAYWRGDSTRQQLSRLYGIAFPTQAQLDDELRRRSEAERRDHRRVGTELQLYLFTDYSPGAPIFLPRGTIVYNELIALKRQLMRKWGYQEIRTPTMMKRELWDISGHWSHYREFMFTLEVDEEDYAVKPMNCPGSILVYKSAQRSYRELPLRLAEFGHVHRNELSGVLSGLLRVRAFTQDDAHLYVTPGQMQEEIARTISMFIELYKVFDFAARIVLSTRPENRMGEDALWDRAEEALVGALHSLGHKYELRKGEGAFYGPKIDFEIQDCIGRDWQCGTIQLDFQLPERFDLEYIDKDGKGHRPVMIHPATMGSIERFMAILVEEFDGHLPTWLAPTQVIVIPVSEKSVGYAESLVRSLCAEYRAEYDSSDETLAKKIRNAHHRRIPYMLIVGPKEEHVRTVSIRDRREHEKQGVPFERFRSVLARDVSTRKCQPYLADEFEEFVKE